MNRTVRPVVCAWRSVPSKPIRSERRSRLWQSRGGIDEHRTSGQQDRREPRALGLTIERFAESFGTRWVNLQRVETGTKSPSVAPVAEICHIQRKPIGDLIDQEGKRFDKLEGIKRKTIVTRDFRMSVVSRFGLIDRDIVVTYFKARAGGFAKLHLDKGYERIYILGGKRRSEHDGNTHRLTKGDVI